ncbi:MAG: hypothetical protein U1F25_09045 [Rubrivivax sp.]
MITVLRRRGLLALRLVTSSLLAWACSGVVAATTAEAKLAPELRAGVAATSARTAPEAAPWRRSLQGQSHVKVLVLAASDDPELAALRRAIVALGGSVHYNYLSVRALAAMLPEAALPALAARDDVRKVVPDRSTVRQAVFEGAGGGEASLVQASIGAGAALAPLASHGNALDGRGVGIAVLDSGIDRCARRVQGCAWRRQPRAGARGLRDPRPLPARGRLAQGRGPVAPAGGRCSTALAWRAVDLGTRLLVR